MRAKEFSRFANDLNDVFGTIDVFGRVVNDMLMDVENTLMDNPNLDIASEEARIKGIVVKKFKSVLSEFGLE